MVSLMSGTAVDEGVIRDVEQVAVEAVDVAELAVVVGQTESARQRLAETLFAVAALVWPDPRPGLQRGTAVAVPQGRGALVRHVRRRCGL